jgi:hypothetical protein
LHPLSIPLRAGFRFFPHPLPTMPSVCLAGDFPGIQGHDRFTTFHRCTMRGLGPASSPVIVVSASGELRTPEPTTYLLVELLSTFSSLWMTTFNSSSHVLAIPRFALNASTPYLRNHPSKTSLKPDARPSEAEAHSAISHWKHIAPNRLMLAVVTSPRGSVTALTGAATLSQAHLIQPGRALEAEFQVKSSFREFYSYTCSFVSHQSRPRPKYAA